MKRTAKIIPRTVVYWLIRAKNQGGTNREGTNSGEKTDGEKHREGQTEEGKVQRRDRQSLYRL